MKRHLLIDCSFIKNKNWCESALALYAGRLLYGFSHHSDIFDVSAIVWKGFESYIDKMAGYEVPKIVIDGHHYVTPWPPVDRALGLISFKRELRERKIDVVLSPYHYECRLFYPKKYHHHAVVHDLFFYDIMKNWLGKYKYCYWRLYHKYLHHKIPYYISISKTTQNALKKLEGISSVVVYNSIPFDFSIQEKTVDCIKDRPYILDVNRLQKYKNAETLVRAFYLIRNDIPHILYIKGDKRNEEDNKDLQNIISELQLDDRVIIDCTYRCEGEMRYLYSHADLFVSPSLKEGFGWTPIEAAILKVPVLVSDIDVLKEVTCSKVPTFDPYSTEDLAEKMLMILNNPPSKVVLDELARFFQERYSLKRQIDSLTELFLQKLSAKKV